MTFSYPFLCWRNSSRIQSSFHAAGSAQHRDGRPRAQRKIAAAEREYQVIEKPVMLARHGFGKGRCELGELLRIGVQRHAQAMRHQRIETPKLSPIFHPLWI